MKFRHNDKNVYNNVIKYVRTYNMDELRNQEYVENTMESLLSTYGYTAEYNKAQNQIFNYLIKRRKK